MPAAPPGGKHSFCRLVTMTLNGPETSEGLLFHTAAPAAVTNGSADLTPQQPSLSNFAAPLTPDNPDEGVFTVDHGLRLSRLDVTPGSRLFGGARDLIGRPAAGFFQGEMRARLRAAYKKMLSGETSATWNVRDPVHGIWYDFHILRVEGGYSIDFRATNVPAVLGSMPAAPTPPPADLPGGAAHDSFFRFSADAMCILDEEGQLVHVNPAAERLLDVDRAALPTLIDLIHKDDRESARDTLGAAGRAWELTEVRTLACRCCCREEGAEGCYRWLEWRIVVVPHGERRWLYATARDINEAKIREDDLRWQVQHDLLTDLPNRTLFHSLLHYALASAQRRGNAMAVLFIDLDGFKRVNDSLNHAAGDELIIEVAKRLKAGLRKEDTVARLSGDEFVVLLPNLRDHDDAVNVAEKLLDLIKQPVVIAGHHLRVTGSIGISLYPNDGATGEALLRSADMAMYRAKNEGPGRLAVYEKGTGQLGRDRLKLESRLSQAFERREFFLHYQPQISLTTGQVVGVEALMRWHHDEIGHIPPTDFIPIAEETGLIGPMGQWAMEEACRQAVDWRHAGFPVRMSVNLSPSQLADARFPDFLGAYLQEIGMPAHQVDLELTEGVFIQSEGRVLDALGRLKEMGLRLSVDDFGTKFAIFSYLQKLPIDGIKVDRSFVAKMDTSPADAAVVRAIIDLGHTLGLRVIAEGVETATQRDKLLQMECDIMQGHLFSAAMPSRDMTSLLARRVP
jgi:diguanylate cyclase (GGDEF)-like protein/PAS domain S-box-containing protein